MLCLPSSYHKCVALERPMHSSNLLSPEGRKPSGKALVVSIPSMESSLAGHISLGVSSYSFAECRHPEPSFSNLPHKKGPQGFDHPHLPALRVAINVLNANEGFIWKAIRGAGLAYGGHFAIKSESGHVCLSIDRSPNGWKAATEAGKVVKYMIDGKVCRMAFLQYWHKHSWVLYIWLYFPGSWTQLVVNELIMEAAKSSLAFHMASSVSNPADAVSTEYMCSWILGGRTGLKCLSL